MSNETNRMIDEGSPTDFESEVLDKAYETVPLTVASAIASSLVSVASVIADADFSDIPLRATNVSMETPIQMLEKLVAHLKVAVKQAKVATPLVSSPTSDRALAFLSSGGHS